VVIAYYLDSSVAGHILHESSANALRWFGDVSADDEAVVVSSRLLRVELTRMLRRDGGSVIDREVIMEVVTGIPVTESVWSAAEAIESHVKTLDAIHLASALATGLDPVIVTHDAQMKAVARVLGLETFDPVAA
jgi:predicted nucleic acid-binding protein